jgi:hypothetical protein
VNHAPRFYELGGLRGGQHHEHGRRQDRKPSIERRVAEHVLQELLANERRAHERAEDDHSRAGHDPEDAPPSNVEVVQRVLRPTLPDKERDPGNNGDGRQSHRKVSGVRRRLEIDCQHERRYE